MLKPFVLIATMGLIAPGADEPNLYPCKCRELTLEEHVSYASVIATAVVTEADDRIFGPWWCRFLSLFKEQYGQCRLAWTTLRPTRVWKGSVASTFGTASDTSRDGCGPFFEEGEEYLVFISQTLDGPFTSKCSGTRRVSEAEAFLRELGPPKETP